MEGCARILRHAVTVHHGHMPEITLTGSDTATGIWAMEDYVDWGRGKAFRGYGHYHEHYAKDPDAGWQITNLKLTRLRRTWL